MLTVKHILKMIFTIGCIFIFSTYWHFENSLMFGHILTFLSITTGFTITALSIISVSSFSKDLYKKEISDDNSKTLLHKLIDKFESSTFIFISAIVLILIFSFIDPIELNAVSLLNTEISVKSILSGIIWYLTFLSIWLFVSLLKMFTKFIIQSAKRL